MIFNISDNDFKKIMKNSKFYLPMRWDGKNFEDALEELFKNYIEELCNCEEEGEEYSSIKVDLTNIRLVCHEIRNSVKYYHNGFPALALKAFNRVMKVLINMPIRVYQKSGLLTYEKERLNLFRLRNVNNDAYYSRKDIFHVPVSSRSKILTSRYSIAGYPSLYLTTSVELGMEELRDKSNVIVSKFKLIRKQKELNIKVLELGIKPQDFYEKNNYKSDFIRKREFMGISLEMREVKSKYLIWYPLIAACSFIRADKDASFSSEYIVPQLLMQWIRKEVKGKQLIGIRYFSCASVRASDMGFDYVFPVNNTDYEGEFCTVLRDSFLLTEPVFVKEYDSVFDCENDLISKNDLEKI